MDQRKWERRVGQNIRKYRQRRGLTLQETADKFGCALRSWQKFETGKNIELYSLIRISEVLAIEPDKLLK
jgi:transcriptional regulator with XRE-family HTH domain